MSSLKADFDELIARIQYGRELNHASYEPIYYLIFPPKQILEVKRQMPAWKAKLSNMGWEVHTFSIAENILDIFQNAPQRKIWLTADAKAPLAWEKTNLSLANVLTNGTLHKAFRDNISQSACRNIWEISGVETFLKEFVGCHSRLPQLQEFPGFLHHSQSCLQLRCIESHSVSEK